MVGEEADRRVYPFRLSILIHLFQQVVGLWKLVEHRYFDSEEDVCAEARATD